MRLHVLAVVAVCLLSLSALAQDAAKPASPQAYLESALAALESKHVNRASVDWPRLRAEAAAMARSAKAPADTYPAIDHVIDALHEKHTLLYAAPRRDPKPASGPAEAQPKPAARVPEPTGELLEGRIGYLRIPAFPYAADHPDADLFVAMSRRILRSHDRADVCGWIIDLRGNTGGNVWPMLDGVLPLLAPRVGDDGRYFSFDVDGKVKPVTLADGRLVGQDVPERPAYALWPLRHAAAPIAILIDGDTASSGETVGIAFKGLRDVRFFGETSANYVTVNNPVRLSDGAVIQMTVGYTVRRDGRRQSGPLVPDEPAGREQARDAALRWLPQACGAG